MADAWPGVDHTADNSVGERWTAVQGLAQSNQEPCLGRRDTQQITQPRNRRRRVLASWQIPAVRLPHEQTQSRSGPRRHVMRGDDGIAQRHIGQAVDRLRGESHDLIRSPPQRIAHAPIFAHLYDTFQCRRSRVERRETVVAQTIHDLRSAGLAFGQRDAAAIAEA